MYLICSFYFKIYNDIWWFQGNTVYIGGLLMRLYRYNSRHVDVFMGNISKVFFFFWLLLQTDLVIKKGLSVKTDSCTSFFWERWKLRELVLLGKLVFFLGMSGGCTILLLLPVSLESKNKIPEFPFISPNFVFWLV